MSFPRARRWRVLLVGATVASALVPAVAGADRGDDDRAALVDRQRELVAELDTLHASDEELAAAIETLDAYIELKSVEVAHAQDVLAQAVVAAEAARLAEAEKQAEVAHLEDQMAAMAVAAYVAPPQADRMETMLSASAPSNAASLEVYMDVQNGRDTDLVRRLRNARAALGDQRRLAEEAEARAQTSNDQAVAELSALVAARDEQAAIHALVLLRMGEADHESGLIALGFGPLNDALLDSARAIDRAHVPLTAVRGIRVHRSVAAQLEGLLEAAEADGIVLRGGGHRTNEQQIALRRAHCGGDDHYSIWERPAGECSPPTAVPGSSNHELGLAVDFTHDGSVISTQSSPAFVWLAENAHRFGFYNLPSEPWHWSVNGQ